MKVLHCATLLLGLNILVDGSPTPRRTRASGPMQTDPVVQLLYAPYEGSTALSEVAYINESRIESMNENRIRIQVVSNDPTPPALTNLTAVRALNDQLASAIAPYPNRFRGFCSLPMGLPEEAATELKRCVSSLGFVGALIDNHLAQNETFYDDTTFDPVWEAAQELDVPIYLHPTYPQIEDFNGTSGRFKPEGKNWSQPVAAVLGTNAWGWHSDSGLQFVRLWLGGVFDRFPNVKIVLGHMGETVPFMLERTDSTIGSLKITGVTILDAWAKNVWVTTSGFFTLSPFAALLGTTAPDRIMFSVDYPWSLMEDDAEFMEKLKNSKMVNESEWEAIAFGNAETLLKLN